MTGPSLHALGRSAGDPSPGATAVPAVLALGVVALQIAYPLVTGAGRDRVTVAIVVVFALASLSHAAVRRGPRFAVLLAVVAGGVGMGAELVGVATGWPFGGYGYTGMLGWQVGGVPLIIPLAWTMMAYPALVVARHITRRPALGVPLAAWALTAWDLFLDPQMVADGQWAWAADGAYLGIPLSNYAGWLATSAVIVAVLWPAADRAERHRGMAGASIWSVRRRGDAVPVALYLWTWAGSTIAHAAWLDLPGSAVVGGLGMGAVVAAWVVTAGRGR